ncbi:unnamed protein product [Blepharisma stoltei]|uniref:Uncharacterized protein n=1 Tax=Blepharisma stoltei TaxID=1481888 RepID=A0AAU9KCZ8_9CILI|nr:unnamed protein product [Blepharisma stoltei]
MDLSRSRIIYHFKPSDRDEKAQEMVMRFRREKMKESYFSQTQLLEKYLPDPEALNKVFEEDEDRYDEFDSEMDQMLGEIDEIIKTCFLIPIDKANLSSIPKLPLKKIISKNFSDGKLHFKGKKKSNTTRIYSYRSITMLKLRQNEGPDLGRVNLNRPKWNPFLISPASGNPQESDGLNPQEIYTERIKRKSNFESKPVKETLLKYPKVLFKEASPKKMTNTRSKSAFDIIASFNRNGKSRSEQLTHFNRPILQIPILNASQMNSSLSTERLHELKRVLNKH